MILLIIFWIACGLTLAALLWGAYCNEKTYQDRIGIAKKMLAEPNWEFIYWELQRVPYDVHFKARVRRQDWKKLYNQRVFEL